MQYASYFSLPEFMEFPTVVPGQKAYAYFYAPHNHIFQGSSDEKPPLLVRTHGNQLYDVSLTSIAYFILFVFTGHICSRSY